MKQFLNHVRLLIVLGLLIVGGGIMNAQAILPLQPAADGSTGETRALPTLTLIVPRELHADNCVIYETCLISQIGWIDLNAPGQNTYTYRLRLKEVGTGRVINVSLETLNCAGDECVLNVGASGLMNKLVNGYSYRVWVVALQNGVVVASSSKASTTALISKPVTLAWPTNQTASAFRRVEWYHNPSVQSVIVVITDRATGAPVHKAATVGYCLGATCSYTVPDGVLQSGKNYRWHVKTVGYNGLITRSVWWWFMYEPNRVPLN